MQEIEEVLVEKELGSGKEERKVREAMVERRRKINEMFGLETVDEFGN